MLGTLLKSLLEGMVGGGIAGAAARGVDAAEKILVGRVLKEVETHAGLYLGPSGKVGLATTFRLAHLAACLVVLAAHARREAAEAAMARATPADRFSGPARLGLHRRLASPGTGPEETDAALAAALDAAAEAALADKARAAAARQPAEDAAWADLRATLSGLTLPDGLEERFRSDDPDDPGWYAGFLAFFRHHLAEKQSTQLAFVTTRLVALRGEDRHAAALLDALAGDMRALGEATARIEAAQREHHADAMAGQRRLEALVKDAAGSGKPAVEAIAAIRDLLRPGNPDVDAIPAEQLPGLVRRILEDLRKPTVVAPDLASAVRRAIEEAERLAADLRFADAAATLDAAIRQRQAERESQARDDAALLAERARISRLQLRYPDAAAFYADAAARVPFDRALALDYALRSARALADQGSEFGDNKALADAIARYRAALALAPRQNHPDNWAAVQNNLGIVLDILGRRESGTARLKQAVAAFRAALEVRTRRRVPRAWAEIQSNIGVTLCGLGERESGTAWLEQAVAAFREALKEISPEHAPLVWAKTQDNLGHALRILGERKGSAALLERAIGASREALKEIARERAPLVWAGAQNNLGTALAALGEREDGAARLEEAIAAYHEALLERTRERAPFLWAQTTENLALAEGMLADRGGDLARGRSALSHAEAALAEYTRTGASIYIEKATRLRDHLAARFGPPH